MDLDFTDLIPKAAPGADLSFDDLVPQNAGSIDPRDFTSRYNTQLAPEEEQKFNQWAQANNRVKDSYDYDMRGAYQELMSGQTQQADNGHFTDKFKKPNHPTFSDESQYNGKDGFSGGQWAETPKGTYFAPGQSQSKLWPDADLSQYFQQQEPDITLLAPDLRDRIANGSAAPPPPPSTSGQVMMDDGQLKSPLSPLVQQYAQNPRVQAAQAIKRGTIPGEIAAIPLMVREGFHRTLIPSMIDDANSGAQERQAASDAEFRANYLENGPGNRTRLQQQMTEGDPVLAAQQMGDQPGRPLTNPAEQRQLARDYNAAAIPKEAAFAQNAKLDRAESEAVPSYDTAEGLLGKIFAGTSSAGSMLMGSLPAIENAIPVSRGKTLFETAKRAFMPNAAAGLIADPLVQANNVSSGLQEKYSGEQTALAGVVGGVAGSALNVAPQAIGNALGKFRGWIETRAAKRLEDMAPDEAAHWLTQAQDASESAGAAVSDPEFAGQMIQQNTGLDAARPTDPASVAAQRKANKARGSELAETFNDVNVWPRDKVEVGPEGVNIPDGTPPVRDAAGQQARIDTLAPRGQAADMLREMGVENPSARELDTVVKYIEGGLSPRGAVNAFRRAASKGARDERGMTPDLERTAGEQANAATRTQEAFDIADLRRQRREKDLDKWEPDLQADYSAGAPRADDITPRMEQDLAARSQAPAPGVGTNQPAPRRSVDVIGSKSVGGLRGEYLPGDRPGAPEVPPTGRTGDMFEGERTEPRLDAPEGGPAPKQPAEATTAPMSDEQSRAFVDSQNEAIARMDHEIEVAKAAGDDGRATIYQRAKADLERSLDQHAANNPAPKAAPVEPVAPDQPATTGRARPEGKPTRDKHNGFEWEQWEKSQYENATPEVKAQADDLEARARAEYSQYHKKSHAGPEGYNKPNPTPDQWMAAKKHYLEWSRLGQERERLLRGSDDLMNPIARDNHANLVEKTRKHEEMLVESRRPRGEPKAPEREAPVTPTPEPKAAPKRGRHGELSDADAARENLPYIQRRLAEKDLDPIDRDQLETWRDRSQAAIDAETPATPTPEAKASPKADEGPANAEKLRQLEHELSLSRYFDDTPDEVAALEKQIADLKGGQKAPEKAAPKAESTGALDAETAKALDDRLSRVNWDEKGGKLLRDDAGKAAGRTKWLSSDPDVHKVLTEFGYTSAEARNLLDRAATGKGRPLTEKQQRFVADLVEAHKGPQEHAGDDFDLDSHTDADLKARDQETQQAKDKADKTRTTAENKAQADKDRDDFTLSGSDRTADKAAAHGQKPLFDVTGAAIHGTKAALGAVGKGVRALVKAIWQGSDTRNAREHSRDLAESVAQLMERRTSGAEKKVARVWREYVYSASESLRALANKTESAVAKQLAGVFHATAGRADGTTATADERAQLKLFGGKDGFMNRVEAIHNRLHEEGLTTPAARAQIVRLLENPGTPRTGKIGQAAKDISQFFADAHAYLKDAGIDMGEVKGYFPREHDTSLVESKRPQFVDAATKAYQQDNPALSPKDARAKAEEYWSAVVHGTDKPPGAGGASSVNPKPDFMKGRVFSKAAAKHLEPFYSRDLSAAMANYALRAVKRAELAKSGVNIKGADGKTAFQPFGDNFEHWDKIRSAILKEDPKAREVLDQINALVSVNAGIPVSGVGPKMDSALSWVRTVGTLGMLEKSALASVGELATSPLRGSIGEVADITNAVANLGGHAINTLRAVIGKKGRSQSTKEAFAFSDGIGATTESDHGSTMAARFAGGDPSSKLQAQFMTSFFQRNMLTPLTEYTRAMSGQQARLFMRRLSSDRHRAGGNVNRSDFFLSELGVPKGKEAAFAAYVNQFGKKLPGVDDLKGPMGEIYKTAALRFIDQSVQRPTVSTKPKWASHPLGKVLFQFNSFNYTFQVNVLNRMARIMANGDALTAGQRASMAATMGVSLGTMVGIQRLVGEVRDEAYSRPDQKKLTTGAKWENAVSRAGLLGAADPWVQAINGGIRFGREPTQIATGPTLGQALSLLGSYIGPNSDKTNTAERRRMRILYQTFGEPALQAALSALPAGPVAKALTVYGVPKLGEAVTDKVYPDNKKHRKSDDVPMKGMVESAAAKLFGKDDDAEKEKDKAFGF